MLKPFTAHRMNQQFRRADIAQLSYDLVEYATEAMRGLHRALLLQTEPVYHRPEHPIDGWGLTATPLRKEGDFMGVPTVTILGRRAIYLSTQADVMKRVLTVPHPRILFEERVVQIKDTNVPALLAEDPTLYYGLLNSAEESIQEFGLDYKLPEVPLGSDIY